MAETAIEWTERTWNPIVGCSIVSPGCTNCYAMAIADRFKDVYLGRRWAGAPAEGLTRRVNGKSVWTGQLLLAPDHILTEPLRRRKPTTYFVNSMGDLFHEDTPEEWIDLVIAIMALCPQHTFQILTKRGERMRKHMSPTTSIPMLGRLPLERIHLAAAGDIDGESKLFEELKRHGNLYSLYCSAPWPLPNVWLGVSAEDQKRADERVPDLLMTPAAVRFVSAEPLLGPIEFAPWLHDSVCHAFNERICTCSEPREVHLDWIIVGGESGPKARPMHPDWARAIRDQCAAAGTAFFFKQWGEWLPADGWYADHPVSLLLRAWDGAAWREVRGDDTDYVARIGKKRAGRLLDGVEHNAMPEVRHG